MDIKSWLSQQSQAATSVFHMGKYCQQWKASTNQTGHPSFHIVLEGQCWLALEERTERTPLSAGDIIFFFSNRPFFLVSSPDSSLESIPRKKMVSLDSEEDEGTGLLCGFLRPRSYQSELLFALMPEHLIIQKHMKVNEKLHLLFDLLRMECWQAKSESDLTLTRLTDLMLIYVIEEAIEEHMLDASLLKAADHPLFATLFLSILKAPQEEWAIDNMAAAVHMSRSTFIRRLHTLCGYTPNELLTRLRVSVAINLLRRGLSVEVVSGRVGYESQTGFYKAFRKITGDAPGVFIKKYSADDDGVLAHEVATEAAGNNIVSL